MRRQEWLLYLLAAALFAAAVAGSVLYFKAVFESDLPGWLKFLLL